MALPVTVYRSDDDGAPVFDGTTMVGFKNIIVKCLVDGYGAKNAAGWSLVYEDNATFKFVVKASEVDGSGGYVQFGSPSGNDTFGGYIKVQGARYMSGIDDFQYPTYQHVLYKANAINPVKWVIMATSVSMYFAIWMPETMVPQSETPFMFIGDFQSAIVGDQYTWAMMLLNNSGDYSSTGGGSWFGSNPNHVVGRIYETDGGDNSLLMYAEGGSISPIQSAVGIPQLSKSLAPVILSSPSPADDKNGNPHSNSQLLPAFRGWLPGLYRPLFSGYSGDNLPLELTINDIDYLGFSNLLGGLASAIRVDSWYD